MKRLFILSLGVLLLINSAMAEDTIDLTFNWPVGLTLDVERQYTRLVTIPGHNSRQHSKSTFRWTTTQHEHGLAIEFSDFKYVEPMKVPENDDPVVQLEYVVRNTEPLLPTLIVNAEGQLLGVEKLEDVIEAVNSEVDKIQHNNDPQFLTLKRVSLNWDAMRMRSMENWDRMVQTWTGKVDVAVGEPITVPGESGQAAGLSVNNTWTFTVKRIADSDRVKLSVVQIPSRGDAMRLLKSLHSADLMELLGKSEDATPIFEITYMTETDPKTLIPTRYEKCQRWGALVGEHQLFLGQSDTWTYDFKNPKEPSLPQQVKAEPEDHGIMAGIVQDHIRTILKATYEADVDTVLRYTHPKVIEMLGGKEKAAEMLRASLTSLHDGGMKLESLEFPAPPTFIFTPKHQFAIVPTLSIMSLKGQRVESLNYQFGILAHGETDWTFMEGSRINQANVRTYFPDFPENHQFPEFYRRRIE